MVKSPVLLLILRLGPRVKCTGLGGSSLLLNQICLFPPLLPGWSARSARFPHTQTKRGRQSKISIRNKQIQVRELPPNPVCWRPHALSCKFYQYVPKPDPGRSVFSPRGTHSVSSFPLFIEVSMHVATGLEHHPCLGCMAAGVLLNHMQGNIYQMVRYIHEVWAVWDSVHFN